MLPGGRSRYNTCNCALRAQSPCRIGIVSTFESREEGEGRGGTRMSSGVQAFLFLFEFHRCDTKASHLS